MTETPKRILFVDDDRVVLQGLERMLFEWAEAWDLHFVDHAEAALAALDESHFDVIVTDARMAGMDGAALLSRVRVAHPDVIRVILTGHSELEATLRAMPVAHSFLTKPCKPELLVQVLQRGCALRDLLEREDLRTLVGGVAGLPVKPEVYSRLTEALASPNVEAAELARIVSRDVALSGKVLHLTNSAFFGTRRNFISVEQAVAFIGARMLRKVVLSAEVFTAFRPEEDRVGVSLDAEQHHALCCAGLARAIAPDPEQAEYAFLAGMLHDIGKLVWATHAPGLMRELEERRAPGQSLLPHIEEGQAGTLHGRVGAYLLGLWGLEHPLVEAVAHHHDPASIDSSGLDLPTIVHVADALTHEIENQRAGVVAESMLDREHLARLGVEAELDRWRELGQNLWDREAR
ncbi:MAG TPA: response regulator, partial [Polyangiaceae bacterium]|nr:response regulator [Polyangiaceae bacterium]